MTGKGENAVEAEFRQPTSNLIEDMAFFQNVLGFRLDKIFPADNPAVAVLSAYGTRIRLERGAPEAPATLRLHCHDPNRFANGQSLLVAPNGMRVELTKADAPVKMEPPKQSFAVRRLSDREPWVIGRAGMQYRDLIPDRLGGSIIASHIRIPDGGPVPDMVHYHTVGFQLIFCYRGWVRLVYEDQGSPFILSAGDCVIQPPQIRHRVLEASDNLQVIEVGVPADHMTTIDHDMELPTRQFRPDRSFQGTRFCHHKLAEAAWGHWRLPGFKACDTGIGQATGGLAGVHVARTINERTRETSHGADILFNFVLEGSFQLDGDTLTAQKLTAGDAFVIPPGTKTIYKNCSPELELLEVSLPATFETKIF